MFSPRLLRGCTRRTDHQLRRFLVGFLTLHLLWIFGAEVLRSDLLPAPWVVYQHLPTLIGEASLFHHLAESLLRLAMGLALSVLLALAGAVGMYFFKSFRYVLDGLLYFVYPVPKLILLPIIMVLCGLGNASKVTMLVLVLVFQLMVNIRDALAAVPQRYVAVIVSLRGNRRQLLRHVLLPAIAPTLFSSVRVALGTAISVLFVTETYGTDAGVGYLIVDLWMRMDYMAMYGAIVMLALTGFLLFILFDYLERFVSPQPSL